MDGYARDMAAAAIDVHRPGQVAYRHAWAWQQARADDVRAGAACEALAVLEHPPVYTCGRRSDPANLLASPERLAEQGIEVVDVERGGDVTYHGPGQLVAYPILDLRRRGIYPIGFVRGLEQALVATLETLGVPAAPRPNLPGVWVGNDKIAALGVHVRGGVSMHGISLNLAPDLTAFDAIVPCGIQDAGITSVERYCGVAPNREAAKEAFITAFAQTFQVEMRDVASDKALVNGH